MREKGTQVVTDDFEHWLRSAQLRRGKLPFRTIETSLMDGRWVMTTETTAPNGWMLCVITDISELGRDWRVLRQERDQARKAAFSDELTGLSNRRYLLENLRRKLGPHKASAAAVVLLDLDHFKQVNDVHGHEVGDVVLKHFAGLLQAEVGRQELAGRLGGEEFLLVLDIGDTSLLRARVDRLLERVRQSSPAYQGGVLRYTCSAGVAQALPGESEAQLIRRADAALYQAKQQGRDRWVLADATAVMPERRGSRSQRATPD
jgi:diguanylate cyclase (GGDEF)-like protein